MSLPCMEEIRSRSTWTSYDQYHPEFFQGEARVEMTMKHYCQNDGKEYADSRTCELGCLVIHLNIDSMTRVLWRLGLYLGKHNSCHILLLHCWSNSFHSTLWRINQNTVFFSFNQHWFLTLDHRIGCWNELESRKLYKTQFGSQTPAFGSLTPASTKRRLGRGCIL